MVDVGDKGVIFGYGGVYSQFVPVTTPNIGDRVMIVPVDDIGELCIPMLTFTIGDKVWIGPDFKFAGFNWKFDKNLKLIPIEKPIVRPTVIPGQWSARYGHETVVLPDGTIVLLGGWQGSPGVLKNDIWLSFDKGVTWGLLKEHAEWSPRYEHKCIVLSDGKIILLGGYASPSVTDVWQSSDYGSTWTCLTNSAPFGVRNNVPALVKLSNNDLLLLGGSSTNYGDNDIWKSTDGGTSWTRIVEHAEWSGRGAHTVNLLPNGDLLLIAGIRWGYTYLQDIWKSIDSGMTWTLQTGSPGIGQTYEHETIMFSNDYIIVIIGAAPSGGQHGIWETSNEGITWEQLKEFPEFPNMYAPFGRGCRQLTSTNLLSDGSLVIIGGNGNGYHNDTWISTDKGVNWTKQS
jgi:hypothetical protein